MLGKASDIKFQHICDRQSMLQDHLDYWKKANPSAEIIDIKFSTNYDQKDESTLAHALIIYKVEN